MVLNLNPGFSLFQGMSSIDSNLLASTSSSRFVEQLRWLCTGKRYLQCYVIFAVEAVPGSVQDTSNSRGTVKWCSCCGRCSCCCPTFSALQTYWCVEVEKFVRYLSTAFFCTLSKTYYEFAVLKDVHCPCLSAEKTNLLKIPVQFGCSEPVLISSILDKLAQKLFQHYLGLF